jgi:hypothetical protein
VSKFSKQLLIDVIAIAIREARFNDPIPVEGVIWADMDLSNEQAAHYARAVMHVLDRAGLVIVERSS